MRIFPDEAACLRLVSALAMENSAEWMERACLRAEDSAVTEEPVAEVARCEVAPGCALRPLAAQQGKCGFTELPGLDLSL